jgi:hypothetical protein
MRLLRRNCQRVLAAQRIEAVPCRFLRALATAGVTRFGAPYSRDISIGATVTTRHPPETGGPARCRRKAQEHSLAAIRMADWIVPPVVLPLLLVIV